MATLDRTVEEIRDFKVQGANNIAIYGMKFLRQFARRHGFGLKFEAAAHFIEEARPTAVVMHNCVEILKKKKSMREFDRLERLLRSSSEMEARYADRLVRPGATIMTYCHSGEAVNFIRHLWAKHKKKISVIACETEPLEQGLRTANDMIAAGIPVTLIDDNAAGFFMRQVDMVVVGSDAMRREGNVNKIGTSMVCGAAKSAGKPVYVVASTFKIDNRKNLKIEERPAREIYRKIFDKKRARGIKVRNPAFDITPWKNVTAVITEKGIMKPEKVARLAGK